MGSLYASKRFKPGYAKYGKNIHRAPDQIEKIKDRERLRITNSEDQVQLNVAKHIRQFFPGVWFYSDTGSGGIKTKAGARRSAKMSLTRGWPDMMIPLQRHGFVGLFIELKRGDVELKRVHAATRPTKGETKLRQVGDWWDKHIEEQATCHEYLRSQGYYADFAVGEGAAIKLIDWYLGREDDGQTF